MLEFVLNKNEFLKCRKEFIIREIFFWTLFEIIGAIFVFIMTMVFIKANKNLNSNFYFVTLFAWIIFSIVCNIKNKKIIDNDIKNKIRLLENKNMFGTCKVEVLKSGIRILYNEGLVDRIYPWKIIREVFSFRDNVYFFISSIDYVSIPKGAFKNKEERISFLNKVSSDRNNFKERVLSIIGLA